MSIKGFITNFILEQDDNLVTITPDQYLELLDNVGGVAERVSKLKPYKGKGIVINGNLDLGKYKNIGPLTGVVRVMGRLDISDTNVPHLNGVTVDGYTSDYKSTMWRTRKQAELNKKLNELNVLRVNDEWNVENGEDDSERTTAIYDVLKTSGMIGMTEDEEGNEIAQDKYFLYPRGRATYGYGKQYEWLGNDDEFDGVIYDVYTEDEARSASRNAVENMIDDMGFDAFRDWVWDSAIDKEQWRNWLDEFYSDIINDDPEGYEIPLSLSSTQQAQVDKFKKSIEELKVKLTAENLSEDQKNIILKKIEGFENIIEDIEEDPQGDYDEDYIQSLVDERVEEFEDDIQDFVKYYGFDKNFMMDFVDLDDVTNEVVRHDGFGGLLNSYDGEEDLIDVNGEEYYVMRVS